MRILDDAVVRAALPMAEAVDVIRDVMAGLAAGRVHQPLRTAVRPPGLGLDLLLKPAALLGDDRSPSARALGVKVLTLGAGDPARGIPAIDGVVVLFDPDTGTPVALLDAASVTEIRTGAASAVATDLLADPGAGDLALLGAGVQARSHLAAMATVRDLRRIRVWSRTPASVEAFVAWAAGEGWDVQPCASPREALAHADLVCTVTSATEPLVQGSWLAPGCHVNAVGAHRPDTRELASSVMAGARIVVDSLESARAESGDVLLAIADGAVPPDVHLVELGDLLRRAAPEGAASRRPGAGRRAGEARTVFVSLGLAAQDLAAAARVLAVAEAGDLGTRVHLGPRPTGPSRGR